jgi:hypothetical protein
MLNSKIVKSIFITISFVFLISCTDIFENDISDKTVLINAPRDSLRTTIATQTFWWDFVDGADFYNLQIVYPSFDYIERIILDTTGNYEWRVNAFNSAYSTPYSLYTLIIDSTQDLSLQLVFLKSPPAGSASNYEKITFKWSNIYSANLYEIEIHEGDWRGNIVKGPVQTTWDTVSFNLMEGSYTWGVKALNNNSATQFSISNFVSDRTAPNKPQLKSPAYGEKISEFPVHFEWEREVDPGSSITDSISISTDSIFSNDNLYKVHKTQLTNYNLNTADDGTYFWRVLSIDAAGNRSPYSNMGKFIIE